MKKKHFIFIIQNNNKKRKHIKIKDKSFIKKLKHEPNIVEITHLCIRHGVHTSIYIYNKISNPNLFWLFISIINILTKNEIKVLKFKFEHFK